jgi:hypothetical protein
MNTCNPTSSSRSEWLRTQWPGNSSRLPFSLDSLVWGILRALIAFALVSWACAAQPAKTKAKASSPTKAGAKATEKADHSADAKSIVPVVLDQITFAPSVFEDVPGTGKDPFFPTTTRREPPKKDAEKTDFPSLSLKGISGTPDRKLALIDYLTIAQGEEADIRIGKQSYRVKCLEIRERSALLQIKNQQKELFLRSKL